MVSFAKTSEADQKIIGDWKNGTLNSMKNSKVLKYKPPVNPVTFVSLIRSKFETIEPISEEEQVAWKVATYGWAILDIGVGIISRDPTVMIDIAGLVIQFIADMVNWDSLWGNEKETPVDYNYEENVLFFNAQQSFRFKDPAGRWHIFRALQNGYEENN